MKNLILIRHAESEWGNPFVKDIERRLTEKGRSDAKQMATRLFLQKIIPDEIFSSVASRALETARIFMEIYHTEKDQLAEEKSLYEPSVKSFYKIAGQIPEEVTTAFIFSHNPGISEFVNDLDIHPAIQMPACGVFGFGINSDKWKDFKIAEKEFLFYVTP